MSAIHDVMLLLNQWLPQTLPAPIQHALERLSSSSVASSPAYFSLRNDRIDRQMHEKYSLVSTAEVIVCMREIICVFIHIKLNNNNIIYNKNNKLDNTTKKVIEEEGIPSIAAGRNE